MDLKIVTSASKHSFNPALVSMLIKLIHFAKGIRDSELNKKLIQVIQTYSEKMSGLS